MTTRPSPPVGAATSSRRAHHDDGDRPWWVGHPVVRYPGLAVVVGAAVAWTALDGRAAALVGAPLTIVAGLGVVVACLLLQRGTIRPIVHGPAAVYPPAGVLGGLALVVASSATLVSVLTSDHDDHATVLRAGFVAAGALAAVALVLHLLSLADTWPDRWRPPYDRRSPTPEHGDDA